MFLNRCFLLIIYIFRKNKTIRKNMSFVKEEFKNLTSDSFDKILSKYQVKIDYYQNHLLW